MSALRPCDLVHGNIFYSAINPLASAFEGAVVIPKQQAALLDNDARWGVYDRDGMNISLAAYRRGPHQNRIGQSQHVKVGDVAQAEGSGSTFIYVGPMFMHYGHFLLTSMARLWPLLKLTDRNVKLVFHGDHDIETVCQHMPVAAAVLRAFNLTPANFVRPLKPTRFTALHVPAPSFEETNSAHQIHADVGSVVGRSLERSCVLRPYSNPVVFSKTRLTSGVSRIVNEDEIVERLSQRGIEVVHPETLSLTEQVDLFERAPAVVSYAGSALHTSLLSSRPTNIIGLNTNSTTASSQILIDFLRGNDSSYFYPTGETSQSTNPAFALDFRVNDPVGVAEGILREIDTKTGLRTRLRRKLRRRASRSGLAYPGVQSLWP